MVLVSMFSASAACLFLFVMIMSTSPSMLRRLLAKEWPSIVITLGISWAYTITALSINPHYVHGLWLLFLRIVMPTYLYAIDAIAVYDHLRLHPKIFDRIVGKEDKTGKRRHSWVMVFFFFWGFVLIAMDIARHYLLVQLSKDVNLVTINITNPFNNQPVAFNNVDLATAFFWTATLFMAQSMWAMWTKKMFHQTVTDTTNYEIVLETTGGDAERLASIASY